MMCPASCTCMCKLYTCMYTSPVLYLHNFLGMTLQNLFGHDTDYLMFQFPTGVSEACQSVLLRILQKSARCCNLRLAPKWHGVVTSLSLSFRFILLQGVDCGLHAGLGLHFLELLFFLSTLSSSLPSFCCRCYALAALC